MSLKVLAVLNDAPYETERSYNGLRLPKSLANSDGARVNVFVIGDAAAWAKSGQTVAKGCYNIEGMPSQQHG